MLCGGVICGLLRCSRNIQNKKAEVFTSSFNATVVLQRWLFKAICTMGGETTCGRRYGSSQQYNLCIHMRAMPRAVIYADQNWCDICVPCTRPSSTFLCNLSLYEIRETCRVCWVGLRKNHSSDIGRLSTETKIVQYVAGRDANFLDHAD